jgi:hypothetical protein
LSASKAKAKSSGSPSGGDYTLKGNEPEEDAGFSGSTYSEATAYLKKNGISGDGGLMTKNEWARRKASGSTSTATAHSSYEKYLGWFVTWRLANPNG